MKVGWRAHALRHIAGALAMGLCLASVCANANDGGRIYVVRRGWHIDIGLASADIGAPLAPVVAEFAGGHVADFSGAGDSPSVRYLIFGFGDRRYLLSKHRNGPVMLAALWPGAGMMLVTALGSSPEAAFGADHVISMEVTGEQLSSLQAAIRASIASPIGATPASGIRPYAPGPYGGSYYFESAERYSAVHTCNTWVAEILRAGEVPVRTTGVVFAGQVWHRLRRIEAARGSRGGFNTAEPPVARP